jgi:hypothetical protein
MARFKCEMNLQNLMRCVGSTCHGGLLAPGMWAQTWRAPPGVEPRETPPHTQGAVGYAEYSSRTLTPGLQLCKECTTTVTRSAGLAAGPSVGTALWTALGPSAPFLVGGTVKIAYDLTLWWLFRRVKPPEEVADG